jgi:hypothetical protein
MALTSDQISVRFGVPGNSTQKINLPLTAGDTVYRGSIATTRSGYLVPASSPQSTDIVWGVIQAAGPGTADQATQGIVGGTSNGAVTVEVDTGSFFFASGTGADAITAVNVGALCYVINETTVGLTNGSGTRPTAGVIEAYDTTEIYALGPVAVKLGNSQSTGAPS